MTQESIRSLLLTATTRERLDAVRETLRDLEPAELFGALWPLAVDSQMAGPAFPAAWVLFELVPPCPLPCIDAVRAMLPHWDVSIEEVPFYLVKQFGKARVEQAVEELRRETLTETETAVLETVRYWAGLCPGAESE